MRTTVRVDDDLMAELKDYAHEQGISMAQLFNKTVRAGLDVVKNGGGKPKKPFVQTTYDMGVPKIDLTHTNRVLDDMDVAEFVIEMRAQQ